MPTCLKAGVYSVKSLLLSSNSRSARSLAACLTSSMFLNTVKMGRAEDPSLLPRFLAVRASTPPVLIMSRAAAAISWRVNFGFGGIDPTLSKTLFYNFVLLYPFRYHLSTRQKKRPSRRTAEAH